MGGVAKVFSSIFKGVTSKPKKMKIQKIVKETAADIGRRTQQTSARLGSAYGTPSTLLGGATGITEQAKTSRTLLGS